ncbi:MAG: helix-turn-helix transcriptional regulator [Chloroflexi bacterium]|nr:helix-turn-helix transcriptional regulator [Chloroflexota bacterium]
MSDSPYTLGAFLANLMDQQKHNNVSLAEAAGVSEGVIRNLLKVGIDPKAKDPDARTLRKIADALGVNSLKLFRLVGYIPPAPDANSVRAEYLADVFDHLPPEKQDAVMGVLEAMADAPKEKKVVQEMRLSPHKALAGIDLTFPAMIREAANHLIIQYAMTAPADVERIEPDAEIAGNPWRDLPAATRQRITALIRHKLSLDYDPTMVDPEWRK